MTTAPLTWSAANQQYLTAALDTVRAALVAYLARRDGAETAASPPLSEVDMAAMAEAMAPPPALETLTQAFNLSPFERAILLLCAGVELEAGFAALCAQAQGDPQRASPTFSLALAALAEPHWDALTPAAPLRRWQLLEVGPGPALTTSLLRLDERILHYLAGVFQMDQRLAGLLETVPAPAQFAPSHYALAEQVALTWGQATGSEGWPLIQLCGPEGSGKRAIAATVCALLGLRLYALPAHLLPTAPTDLERLLRLWEREAILTEAALLLEADEADPAEAVREQALRWFGEHCWGGLLLSGVERRQAKQRPLLTFEVEHLPHAEQRALWQAALEPVAPTLNGTVDQLVAHFNLNPPAIQAATRKALGQLAWSAQAEAEPPVVDGASALANSLWAMCRAQARPRLDALAQRIEARAGWADLVLPEQQQAILREVTAHVRQRLTVYESWGFARKSSRGLGISALFAGESGTGKTMAAEVLAQELRLDLYKIDLSAVVSKYIGETEKNLRRIFDAAEVGGVILLFDEADALFGKRSEVKDSHDRYANIEVSYLLQRMESYRGLAVLTTNLKSTLDQAFLRRIRFVIQFPFPDAAQRAEIWQRIFPAETPTEGLDPTKLARLNVAGGNIRNIALNAAFLAADAGEPVRMSHLLQAARSEYLKLEKPLTGPEIRDWVTEAVIREV